MRPPCELIVRHILPPLRSLIAKELIEKYEFSQVEAAKKLGTTQAAISQYLSSKRGEKNIRKLESIPAIKTTVSRIAKGIATEEMSTTETVACFCSLCNQLLSERLLCDMHQAITSLPETCNICPELAQVAKNKSKMRIC